MVLKIERDLSRFKQIVRGKIKKDLRKYLSHGELIGKQGKRLVSIPLPQIEIPRFRFGPKQTGGVGQGQGEPGTPLAPDNDQGEGGEAGNLPGQHILEVDISIEELADILGEELELPRIEPRGKKNITSIKDRYTGISRSGPESLRHFKRTYKEALKRQIASGTYNWIRPRIVPIREDRRYRSWHPSPEPVSNAVIVYMMDVSGSMGEEQKEIVRIESFWIDTWLRRNYDGIESRYIIHDATAREVDQETFYSTRESGGTVISSAYRLCSDMISAEYDPQEWNIYPFHFSDGDNWTGGDNEICVKILREEILPRANIFCYGQVESPDGSGRFIETLAEAFEDDNRIVSSKIADKDAILDSIKDFLGKGR